MLVVVIRQHLEMFKWYEYFTKPLQIPTNLSMKKIFLNQFNDFITQSVEKLLKRPALWVKLSKSGGRSLHGRSLPSPASSHSSKT